jgi:uncharacterized protein YciI
MPGVAYYILFYDYVPDMVTRREPVRPEHLAHARSFFERGFLRQAGAYGDTADGAVLVFESDTEAPVEEFIRGDPYVEAGLVTKWRVRPWNVVIGA